MTRDNSNRFASKIRKNPLFKERFQSASKNDLPSKARGSRFRGLSPCGDCITIDVHPEKISPERVHLSAKRPFKFGCNIFPFKILPYLICDIQIWRDRDYPVDIETLLALSDLFMTFSQKKGIIQLPLKIDKTEASFPSKNSSITI